MKVAVLYAPEDLRLDDITCPEAGPGDVLIKVKAAGICGTDQLGDLRIATGHHGRDEIAALDQQIKQNRHYVQADHYQQYQ